MSRNRRTLALVAVNAAAVASVALAGLDEVGLCPDGVERDDPCECEAPPGNRCYWVDAAAPDGGDGTCISPYNSFEHVVGWWDGVSHHLPPAGSDILRAGDYLYVKGVFSASAHDDSTNSMRIAIMKSLQCGTDSLPTVITSWNGHERAVFDGEQVLADLIWIRNCSGIRIERVRVHTALARGIRVHDNVEYAEFVNVQIDSTEADGSSGIGGGITFVAKSSVRTHLVLRDSEIFANNQGPDSLNINVGGVSIDANTNPLPGSQIAIYDNVIYDERSAIRHKHPGTLPIRVVGNRISASETAMWIRSLTNEIHHNEIFDCPIAFWAADENLSSGSMDFRAWNNTFVRCDRLLEAQRTNTAFARNFTFHDNIFSSPNASSKVILLHQYSCSGCGVCFDINDWASNYNLWNVDLSAPDFLIHNCTPYDFEAASTHLSDSTSFVGDPGFVDEAGNDFRLTPDSDAIAAGTNGVDIGAHPFTATSVPQAPVKPASVLTFTPNPGDGAVHLRFHLERAMPVRVDVFDAGGRRVSTVEAGLLSAGWQSVKVETRVFERQAPGSGVFFVRLSSQGQILKSGKLTRVF